LRALRVTTSTPPPTQEFLKILNQADAIKNGGARFEIHEQV